MEHKKNNKNYRPKHIHAALFTERQNKNVLERHGRRSHHIFKTQGAESAFIRPERFASLGIPRFQSFVLVPSLWGLVEMDFTICLSD